MSANPSYDLDALHRAQRAYEPSMEEILASIRNIISEERPGLAPAVRPAPVAEPPAPPAAAERREPAERAEPAAMPRVVWPKPEAEAPLETQPVVAAVAPPPIPDQASFLEVAADPQDRLISPETDAAIGHSF